jgi:hypothetical protein
MSHPTPTLFYIAVFREDQPGPQYKVFTSMSGLMRFIEDLPFDFGPFDVFVADTESLELAKFDAKPILSAAKRKPKNGGKAHGAAAGD